METQAWESRLRADDLLRRTRAPKAEEVKVLGKKSFSSANANKIRAAHKMQLYGEGTKKRNYPKQELDICMNCRTSIDDCRCFMAYRRQPNPQVMRIEI